MRRRLRRRSPAPLIVRHRDHTRPGPLRVAIVGSGPSAFYAAGDLLGRLTFSTLRFSGSRAKGPRPKCRRLLNRYQGVQAPTPTRRQTRSVARPRLRP
ncbi:MAG: hypothetical protein EOP16_00820 [Pseudonocardia sp.]|nr:MAG: hypothetical protein EOP16_00820 [Pseudonocardia sp.]